LIKRELRGYVAKLDNWQDGEMLTVIVQAFTYAEMSIKSMESALFLDQ